MGALSESEWLSSDEPFKAGALLVSGASREKSSMLVGSDGVSTEEGDSRVSLFEDWFGSVDGLLDTSERRVERLGVDRE